jgi:hypothetical protein
MIDKHKKLNYNEIFLSGNSATASGLVDFAKKEINPSIYR